MDPLVLSLAAAVVGLALGALAGFLASQSRERARREREKAAAKDEASAILSRAKDEAENLRRSRELAGKEEAMRLRDAWEQEETRRREEVERFERRLVERTESLDKKFDALNERELTQERRTQELERREGDVHARTAEVDRMAEEGRRRLEDQLFITKAYFAARSCAIVADYVCYRYLRRPDRKNAGSQSTDPWAYLDNLREVLDVVDSQTPPGPVRDDFYRRFLRVEMLGKLSGRRILNTPFDRRDRWLVCSETRRCA